MSLAIAAAPSALADGEDDFWPEPVYFPQKAEQAPVSKAPQSKADAGNDKTSQSKEKKPFWRFWDKPKESKKPVPTEEQIVKVGPKDPPASPFPLIRLPMPFETEEGVISSGIYLLKPDPDPLKQSDPAGKAFVLTQRNQTLLRFSAHPVTAQDPNMVKEGTPSPLTKRDPEAPEPIKVEIRVSPDNRTLTIRLRQGDQTLESPAYPTANDRRQILTY